MSNAFVHRFKYSISFDDVDAAGIVYYPRYFHLCHLAFEDFFNQKGPYNYPTLIKERLMGFPTVHIEADYKAPLKYGDVIVVELANASIKNSSMVSTYRFISDADPVIKFIAHITTVYTDLVNKRAKAIPEDLRRILCGEMS